MKYFLTKDMLYIQTKENQIRGIPLDTLANDELGEQIRYLAFVGAEYDKDIHLEWKIKKEP